ncbi:hypothetical protein [Actinotignum sanguinis]|uniref:Lipoprotein n=1 Tax=Actinotignum sanguinis TaxID=1445614 RepID=A0ABT5V5P4_9ACTO|nr:hypothetical protein [Actinotignum sanguinis]MDE1655880.1 hypothetical protein [Actinotignum sanguinis]
MKYKTGSALGLVLAVLTGCAAGDSDYGTAGNVDSELAVSAASEWNPICGTSYIHFPLNFTREEYMWGLGAGWLRRSREAWGLSDPPDIPLVAWQNVSQERNEKLAECYRLKGFSAYAPPQGGVLFDPGVPEAQNESFNLATHECYSKYFLDPEFLANLTEDQLRVQWDYWDEYYIPCLAAHGYKVDISERPARETYATTFYSDAEHRWWPNNKGSLSFQITPEVMKVCPERPPITEFYGID